MGLDKNEVLRTREAIQSGRWTIRGLLKGLWVYVQEKTQWQASVVGGYKVKALDTIGIYRPRLKNCQTKHYNSNAGKALPAINFAVLSAIGKVGVQKVSLPKLLVRGDERATTEEALMQRVNKPKRVCSKVMWL